MEHEQDVTSTACTAKDAEIERLKMELYNALPYMEMHGKRLANDYRGSTSDATRQEGEALLTKVDMLRLALGPNVGIEPPERSARMTG